MLHYADAYEKKLREILKEPIGTISTTLPVTQYREPNNYDWEKRHRKILEMNAANPPRKIFFGNSIIHFWGGFPKATLARDQASWNNFLTPLGMRNLAYGWDRIENVLWRVYHGELTGYEAEQVFVMIGTNNFHLNTNEEIITGLRLLINAIKVRQPKSDLILMGILPRRDQEKRVALINIKIADLAKEMKIQYSFLGADLLDNDTKIDESLFSDGLHPTKKGYQKMRKYLLPILKD